MRHIILGFVALSSAGCTSTARRQHPAHRGGDSASRGTAGTAPSTAKTVSVEIRSSCPQPVTISYDNAATPGSGTWFVKSYSDEYRNVRVGDVLRISDPAQPGLASLKVTALTRTISIDGSCASFHELRHVPAI